MKRTKLEVKRQQEKYEKELKEVEEFLDKLQDEILKISQEGKREYKFSLCDTLMKNSHIDVIVKFLQEDLGLEVKVKNGYGYNGSLMVRWDVFNATVIHYVTVRW